MRVAMDLLSPSNAAGAPVPATGAPARSAVSAGGRLDRHLWRAHDLPADDAAHARSSGFAALDAELPGGGWPQGQLIELLIDAPGLGELSLLAPALAAVSAERRACVWVLPMQDGRRPAARFTAVPPLPYAPALQASGIDPAGCMYVQPATPRESWWSMEQTLRADHLGAVIGWLPEGTQHGSDADFRALRRLHLLAAQQRALVFVLRSTRHADTPSPAALRLQLAQHDGWLQVQVLKRRGRPLLDQVALQVHPESWRAAHVAPPLASEPVEVPAQLARRSAQEALAQREQRWSLKALFSH
jgi:cell division inhibitor SulA/protein ImuA